MWPAAHIVAKSYPLYLAVRMCRYGSLLKINPSGYNHAGQFLETVYGHY